MILKNIEQVVGRFSSGSTLRPLYNGYSLVNVPNTVIKILNKNSDAPGPILDNAIMKNIETGSIKKVIMILIDGLGYEMFLDSYRNSEFFSRFVEDGMVTPLTSGFPSTTTASITTVNTGLTPQEHALPEWTLYFREIDKIIKPMPMVTIDEKREPLRKIIENPKTFSILNIFAADHVSGKISVADDVEDTAYFHWKALPEMAFKSQVLALKDFFSRTVLTN